MSELFRDGGPSSGDVRNRLCLRQTIQPLEHQRKVVEFSEELGIASRVVVLSVVRRAYR